MLRENNVWYQHEYDKYLYAHTYHWFHLPTRKWGSRTVYTLSKDDINRLIDYWNRSKDWIYFSFNFTK